MTRANGTVLLVDDEPHILRALTFLMEQQGFTVLQASNGREGLQIAKANQPDVVVLDVMMPELNGYETARALRQDPQFENTTIIFLTAKGTEQDQMNGYRSGGEIYITKPFDNQYLVDTITEVFQFG